MDGWVSTKWIEEHTKKAADRERRRIRRAQAAALGELRASIITGGFLRRLLDDIDAATRAPRRGRKR